MINEGIVQIKLFTLQELGHGSVAVMNVLVIDVDNLPAIVHDRPFFVSRIPPSRIFLYRDKYIF